MKDDIKILRNECQQWHSLIAQSQLGTALQQLLAAAQKNGFSDLTDKLLGIEKTYNLMRNYFLRGAKDPKRPELYEKMCYQMYQLVDEYFFAKVDQLGGRSLTYTSRHNDLPANAEETIALYKQTVQFAPLMPSKRKSKQLPDQADFLAAQLFNAIWAQPGDWATTVWAKNFIADKKMPAVHRELLLGAMVLRLTQSYVPNYLKEVFAFCVGEDNPRIAARAMVGSLLAIMLYPQQLETKEMKIYIETLLEMNNMQAKLFQVFLAIERSRMVREIEHCMTHNIMPEINKIRNKLTDRIPNQSDQISKIVFSNEGMSIDGVSLEPAPEIEDSVIQLAEWQAEGMDVFLPTFRHMKDFHFFDQLSNWLLPFDQNNNQLLDAMSNESPTFRQTMCEEMMRNPAMCDSDKYSLLMSFSSVPEEAKEKLGELYREEINQTCEMIKNVGQSQWLSETLIMARQFVMDLYRIFYVHPRRAEFINPFDKFNDEVECRMLDKLFNNNDMREALAQYLISHKHYASAACVYEQLLPSVPDDFNIVCITAFARLRSGNIDGALKLYLRAEMLNDQHINVKRRIARCYELLGNNQASLYYLEQAIALDSDDQSLRFALAKAQARLGQHEDALRNLFEVEYKKPNRVAALRAIAYSSLFVGKADQANTYFCRISEADRQPTDLILLGQIHLCLGNMADAADAFRSFTQATNNREALIKSFDTEAAAFAACGLSDHNVQMMKEACLNV